jgi:hypothetical protein
VAINSREAGSKSPHFCLLWLAPSCVYFGPRMVRIKHVPRSRVVHEPPPMALEDETEVPPREMEASPDAPPSSVDDSEGCESRSGGSDSKASESKVSSRMKVAAVAAATRITFNFGPSTVKRARL